MFPFSTYNWSQADEKDTRMKWNFLGHLYGFSYWIIVGQFIWVDLIRPNLGNAWTWLWAFWELIITLVLAPRIKGIAYNLQSLNQNINLDPKNNDKLWSRVKKIHIVLGHIHCQFTFKIWVEGLKQVARKTTVKSSFKNKTLWNHILSGKINGLMIVVNF